MYSGRDDNHEIHNPQPNHNDILQGTEHMRHTWIRGSMALALLANCFVGASIAQDSATKEAGDKAQTELKDESKSGKKKAGKPTKISLPEYKLTMMSPAEWEKKTPRFPQMIKYEFSAPAGAKEGEPTARITYSVLGGSVEGNIQRWKGQFQELDEKKSKVTKFEAAKKTVHWADLRGSFKDTMGAPPFAGRPPKIRDDYRMLGAIVELDGKLLFIKATGPEKVVDKFAKSMEKMLKEMKAE